MARKLNGYAIAVLVADVKEYLALTGTEAPILSKAVSKTDPHMVRELLAGIRVVQGSTADKLYAVMLKYPKGIKGTFKPGKKRPPYGTNALDRQQPYPLGEDPNRDPCGRCGASGIKGCEHRKPFDPPPRPGTAF